MLSESRALLRSPRTAALSLATCLGAALLATACSLPRAEADSGPTHYDKLGNADLNNTYTKIRHLDLPWNKKHEIARVKTPNGQVIEVIISPTGVYWQAIEIRLYPKGTIFPTPWNAVSVPNPKDDINANSEFEDEPDLFNSISYYSKLAKRDYRPKSEILQLPGYSEMDLTKGWVDFDGKGHDKHITLTPMQSLKDMRAVEAQIYAIAADAAHHENAPGDLRPPFRR